MQRYKPLKMGKKKKNHKLFPVDQPAVQLSLHCDSEGAKQTEGGRDFLCGLRNSVGVQYGHLVGRNSFSVGLVLAGGAAHCGSTGWWRWGGSGGAGSDAGRAAGGACTRRGGLLFFGLLAGELCNAEDKLEASQFDVAAVVEQGSAFPARPAAADQAGAARLTAARRLGAAARLAAHHAAGQRQARRRAGALVVLALLTATCRKHAEKIRDGESEKTNCSTG